MSEATKKIPRVCSVEGCGQKRHARGFCAKHYKQEPHIAAKIKYGIINKNKRCTALGCSRVFLAKGVCSLHYAQLPGQREKNRAASSRHRQVNKAKINCRKTALRDQDRILFRKQQSAWKRKNRGKLAAQQAARRATQARRTPKWADKKAIAEFYKNCPPGYHVDHIIPLRGKNVSGLHTLENLQYLPAAENIVKNNKFTPIQGLPTKKAA